MPKDPQQVKLKRSSSQIQISITPKLLRGISIVR